MRWLSLLIILIVLFACTKKSIIKDGELSISASTAYIIKETVNLRSANNTNSQIIKKLNDGQPVSILRNENGWYEIYDDENNKGWLRSDMVGPRELSRTLLATTFVDSVLPSFKTELYFDRTDLYKTIYLILPNKYYVSKANAESYAVKIGKAYQESVYPGKLEIRIMQKNRKDLFTHLQLEAIGNANMPVPIIKKGRLISLNQTHWRIKMNIAVPSDITNSELLNQARIISEKYELPYTKVEIFQTIDNNEGWIYLNDHKKKPLDPEICKLYYLEDKDGEYYKFNSCL